MKNYSSSLISDTLSIVFHQAIDENLDLELLTLKGVNHVEMDLKSLKTINSSGIHSWMIWKKTIDKAGAQFKFINCPQIFVEQINNIHEFLPKKSIIESFFVPYFCEACKSPQNRLYHRGWDYHYKEEGKASSVKAIELINCNFCYEKAEIDVIKRRYFKFILEST